MGRQDLSVTDPWRMYPHLLLSRLHYDLLGIIASARAVCPWRATRGSAFGVIIRTVRVAELEDRQSVDWEPGSSTLRFSLVERDGTLSVVYEGRVPDAFALAERAVVEGEISRRRLCGRQPGGAVPFQV